MIFYSELRTISNSTVFQCAIDRLESTHLPTKERVFLLNEAIRSVMPPVPYGMMRMRECFWRRLAEYCVAIERAGDQRKEMRGRWIKQMREIAAKSGRQWPPKPAFQAQYNLPQRRIDTLFYQK